jgi:hypothetical protein
MKNRLRTSTINFKPCTAKLIYYDYWIFHKLLKHFRDDISQSYHMINHNKQLFFPNQNSGYLKFWLCIIEKKSTCNDGPRAPIFLNPVLTILQVKIRTKVTR